MQATTTKTAVVEVKTTRGRTIITGCLPAEILVQTAIRQGTDLAGADLRGARLGGAVLGGARLRGADLRGANLTRADLRYADLSYCDLRGAVLTGARVEGARFTGARLSIPLHDAGAIIEEPAPAAPAARPAADPVPTRNQLHLTRDVCAVI